MKLRDIKWNSIILFVFLVIFVLIVGIKLVENYEQTHATWTVRSVNYGFAIARASNGDEVLARNPIPNLQTGDKIVVKGFNVLNSTLPYVDSKY